MRSPTSVFLLFHRISLVRSILTLGQLIGDNVFHKPSRTQSNWKQIKGYSLDSHMQGNHRELLVSSIKLANMAFLVYCRSKWQHQTATRQKTRRSATTTKKLSSLCLLQFVITPLARRSRWYATYQFTLPLCHRFFFSAPSVHFYSKGGHMVPVR